MTKDTNRARSQWGRAKKSLIPWLIASATMLMLTTACQPNDPIQEVRDLFATGDLIGSIEMLRELLDEDRDNPEILFLYGQALAWSQQPSLAEWPLRKAMEDPEWFERAGMAVAKSELSGRNYENAAEVFGKIIERNPENMDARLGRAKAFASSPRHLHDALDEVDAILEIDPDDIRAIEPRIIAYLSLGDEEGANSALEDLGARIEAGSGDEWTKGWHCATLAIFAEDSGNEDLARERWVDCNTRFPGNDNVVAGSTAFFDAREEYARSLEIIEAAVEADPSMANAYNETLAAHLVSVNRVGDAEALLNEWANSNDRTQAMQGRLALTGHHERFKNYAAAADSLESALEIHRSAFGPSAELTFWLADLRILADQDDRAAAIVESMGDGAQRTMVLARLAQRRGDYGEAFTLYQDASRLWPENPYAPYHAGHAALALGRFDAALDSFRASIRVSSSATDAPLQAARIYAAQKQWKAASEVLGQFQADLSLESGLFWLEVVGYLGGASDTTAQAIFNQAAKHPSLAGLAVEAGAKGIGRRHGAKEAWRIVDSTLGNELLTAQLVPILRAAVQWAPGEAELDSLEPRIRALVEAEPGLAIARTIEGAFLVRRGEEERAIESFRTALEFNPTHTEAALRLATLIAKQDPEETLDLLDIALSDEHPAGVLEGSSIFEAELFLAAISELDDSDRLVALLERALVRIPLDAGLALRLGEAMESRGAPKKRVLALADRAIRFKAGEEAVALRDRSQAEKTSPE